MGTIYFYTSVATGIIAVIYSLLAIEKMQNRTMWSLGLWILLPKSHFKENGHKHRIISAVFFATTFLLIGITNE